MSNADFGVRAAKSTFNADFGVRAASRRSVDLPL
jgi:hypothetical protein